MKLVIFLTCIASASAGQDLAPPQDWNVEKRPGLFIFRPAHLAAGQNVGIQIHDSFQFPDSDDVIGLGAKVLTKRK